MSEARDRAIRTVRTFEDRFEGARNIQRAVLGHTDGSTVRVADRPDLVYVRLKAKGAARWKVFNDKVADDWGLPVLIEKRPTGNMWEVIDVDKESLMNTGGGWGGESKLPNHASRHEWPDTVPGQDVVQIHARAIVPLRTFSRSYSGSYVRVAPYKYTYDGTAKTFWGGELNLTSQVPAAGKAKYVMTYLDPRDNTLYSTPGDIRTYSSAIPLPVPGMPEYAIPSALVRLWGGQNYVVENDIVDYRILLGMSVPDQAGAIKTPSYITVSYTPDLPNERMLVGGTNIALTDGGANAGLTINTTGLTYAPEGAAYVVTTYDANLQNERMLVAGSNITITDQGAGAGVVIASTGGGGGAPTDAQYVVMSLDGDLTAERVLTAGDNLALVDGGADGNATLNVTGLTYSPIDGPYVVVSYDARLNNERMLVGGANINITDNGADADVTVDATGLAPLAAQYVLMALDGDLTDERVLTAGDNLGLVDGGAGGNATLNVTGLTYAPEAAAYVVATYSEALQNERLLVGGTGITVTDGGAGAAITVASVAEADPFFNWGW